MSRQIDPAVLTQKNLVKGGLAASAPGLAILVAGVFMEPLDLLTKMHLGLLGMIGLAVIFFVLGHLLRKAYWWAGLPGLASAILAIIYFALKFIRPLNAYLEYNPAAGFTDLIEPIMLLSPQLVLVLISLTLGLVIFKTIRLAWGIRPMPVSRFVWGVLMVWLLVLGGDAWYQNSGWKILGSSSDLVLRLCLGDETQRRQVRHMLLAQGKEAVPALIRGLSAGGAAVDTGTDCIRNASRGLLVEMGREALPELRKAAQDGDAKAAQLLKQITGGGS